eukprot:CAMPEP_0118692006 /NCGR_PEP_ID=MMETSP0800-20121206/11013_1 /TAXON_ID=210618 ORGANISM="Striatella unipunctata, Strain CCMP2910" /NCGR_SAMPLE_ID=MMETSP0800 /ASSEMBLY_ACC=CAM_ASM_000638 /LENGTH=209 /DNA_ID=CAMNT_0006589883 /DNA_START=106 /DNA_END=732 /DNA_ORIENTATION=-
MTKATSVVLLVGLLASLSPMAVVCKKEANVPEFMKRRLQNGSNRCWSTEDCGFEQYCSRGICRDNGSCQNRSDCLNPRNLYATVLCLGRIKCSNEGRCFNDCTTLPCGNRPVAGCIEDPCTAVSCFEPYESCISNSCGGCNAVFYNAQGYRVCKSNNNHDNGGGGDDPFPQCDPSDCGAIPRKAKKCPDGFMYRASDCLFDFQEQRCKW